MSIYKMDIRSSQALEAISIFDGSDYKNPWGDQIDVTSLGISKNNVPFMVIAGEFHYGRYPKEEWEDAIIRMKINGINVISTYVFWIYHEEIEGRFDWTGSNDLNYFLSLCKRHKIFVILRIGPYCHGEVRNGGLPDWLYGRSFEVRSNDRDYLAYVEKLYSEIAIQAREQIFELGGCIIAIQLENEYLHASSPWEMTLGHGTEYTGIGSSDLSHISILQKMAEEVGLKTPFYTMTGWESGLPEGGRFLPMLGGYAYRPWYIHKEGDMQPPSDNYVFKDRTRNTPYPVTYCELMGGMQCWYQSRFQVETESVQSIALTALAGGSNFLGYYMFHGGLNRVGEKNFLNENTTPKIDYDFQAPIGAFGQVRSSGDALRLLHYFMVTYQELLIPMRPYIPLDSAKDSYDRHSLRYATRTNGQSGFIFLSNYQDHLNMKDHNDLSIQIKMNDDLIKIPEKGVFQLASGVSGIMPYKMDMGGHELIYSTCQPITFLDINNTRTYFFAAIKGIKPEYKFRDLDLIIKRADVISSFKLQSHQGQEICVYTLPWHEALNLYKGNFRGKDRIFISDGDFMIKDNQIILETKGEKDLTLQIYPPINDNLITQTEDCRISNTERNDGFDSYCLSVRERQVKSAVVFEGVKGQVTMDEEDLKLFDHLWLRVDYEGDVANALSRGRLILDHFHNGQVWEFDLKRFANTMVDNCLDLHIRKSKKGSYIINESEMALQKSFKGEELGGIRNIEFITGRKIILK